MESATVHSRAVRAAGRPDHWLRGAYWWYFAAIGALTPFLTLYYRQLGFSGPQVGLLAATLPLGTALAPVAGALTDATGSHRLVLRGALALAATAALFLARAETFPAILTLIGLLALSAAPIPALLDSYGVTLSEERGVAYGTLRVWGSLGYTAAVWLVGWWMGGRVSPLFLLAYAGSIVLALVATAGLPPRRRSADRGWRGLAGVARNRALLVLLLVTYLVTVGSSVMYNFLGIHLAALGGSARLLGLAYAVAAASAAGAGVRGRMLARLGARRVLALAIGLYAVRFALYSVLPAPAWVLPVQLLHGGTFGAYLLASVTLAHQTAGRERAATAQGLLAAMSFGFGSLTGALGGGLLLDRLGGVALFRLAAAIALLALAVLALGLRATAAPDGARPPAPKRPSTPRETSGDQSLTAFFRVGGRGRVSGRG